MNPTLIAGGVGLVALVLAGSAAWVQTARLHAAETDLKAANQRADDNAAVVERMKVDEVINFAIVTKLEAEKAAIQEKYRADQAAILRAPTRPCAADPACSVALDRMRQRRSAPEAGRSDPAGRAGNAVPGPAAGARP